MYVWVWLRIPIRNKYKTTALIIQEKLEKYSQTPENIYVNYLKFVKNIPKCALFCNRISVFEILHHFQRHAQKSLWDQKQNKNKTGVPGKHTVAANKTSVSFLRRILGFIRSQYKHEKTHTLSKGSFTPTAEVESVLTLGMDLEPIFQHQHRRHPVCTKQL